MIILIAALFIDFAVFANASDSPERWYHHKHAALDEAGFSGRTDAELESVKLALKGKNKYAAEAFLSVSHHNDNGIFYEEMGRLHAVRTGTPLLECAGHIVGRPKNGYVALVYDSDGYPVEAKANNYKWQSFLHISSARKAYRRIPLIYNEISARLPREPKVLYSDASIKPGKLDVKELDQEYFPILNDPENEKA